MNSKFYYSSSNIPSAPVWVEDTNILKIRVQDRIDSPRFMEVWLADPNNDKQDTGTYTAYQRVKVDFIRDAGTSQVFYGRIEYIEPRYDASYGQILVIQAKDALQELLHRKLDFDFGPYGGITTKAHLIDKLIQYSTYTEITYTDKAGGNFNPHAVKNDPPITDRSDWYIRITDGVNVADAKVVYDVNPGSASGTIVVDHLINFDLTNQIANGDTITEYNAVPATTGVTAIVNTVYRNISTTSIDAIVAGVGTDSNTDIGKYSGSSTNALDAIRELAFQDKTAVPVYCYDFFVDNSNIPDFIYFSRGSRNSGTAITLGATETNTVKPMLEDYVFPLAIKESVTHVVAQGLSADDAYSTQITRPWLSGDGADAYSSKIFKDELVFQREQANTTDIDTLATTELQKLGASENVQRGMVRIVGYPVNTITAVRCGELVTINNTNIAAVNGSTMLVTSIDFEEPPGISTTELVGTTKGKAEKVWVISERLTDMQQQDDINAWKTYGIVRKNSTKNSYTTESGQVVIINGNLYFLDSSGNQFCILGHTGPLGGVPESTLVDTKTNGILFLGSGGGATSATLGFPGLSSLWPYQDTAGYLYLRTRQQDNITPQNHIFAPLDTEQGRLGNGTNRWLSANIKTITTDTITPENIKWGSGLTNAAGTATITHQLGAAPNSVVAIAAGIGNLICNVNTVGAATFAVTIQLITATTGDGQHSHGTGTLVTANNVDDHTHGLFGDTGNESNPGDPHAHPVTFTTLGESAPHEHAISGSTANDTPHMHTILNNPGATTFYWIAAI